MNIHGVVISKNDWGNLATAICHTLNTHLDVVHVIDHGSSDRTGNGLKLLKELWGDRLKIYTASGSLPFNQELISNSVVSIAEKEGADWIYVFDSDEFLITDKINLKEELNAINPNIVSVRYKLSNYISLYDFDRENIDDYLKLQHESIPTCEYIIQNAWDAIYSGKNNFFDYPFPQKVIFRANRNLLISSGAHTLQWTIGPESEIFSPSIKSAHLTYISKDILSRKAMLGKSHIQDGHPKSFGWQNQLIYKIYQEGWLDTFWERHSINNANAQKSTKAKRIINHDLSNALNQTAEKMKGFFGSKSLSSYNGSEIKSGHSKQSDFCFDDAVKISSFYTKRIAFLMHQIRMLSAPRS